MSEMATYDLIASCNFGIEAVTAQELRDLGYADLSVENGRVTFKGTAADLVRCNIWLRTADRIFLRAAEFKATDFGLLFEGVKAVRWEDILPPDAKIHVVGKSVQSKLFSVPDCQALTKKAIIEAMKRKYRHRTFPETGATFKVQVALLRDVATIAIDTCGFGLHKRGYRSEAGQAPLKETMAAALVLLSRWTPDRTFADPCCGSGTIPIEAAMIGLNMAPGLNRDFESERWGLIPDRLWEEERARARSLIRTDLDFNVLASDIDYWVLKKARDNVAKAGLEKYISIQKFPAAEFRSKRRYGCLITNPPYGERQGGELEIQALYQDLGRLYKELDTWSFYVLTASEMFESDFGAKSTKNRKLYNATIKCYYYQYYRPLGPRRGEDETPAADKGAEL